MVAKSIMQDNEECYVSGAYNCDLHRHEVYFGTCNRKISLANGFWVYLKPEYHNASNKGVHFNRDLDLKLKKECQKEYEKNNSRDSFIKLIGKSYL